MMMVFRNVPVLCVNGPTLICPSFLSAEVDRVCLSLNTLYIIAGEGAETARSLGRANKPAIITLFQHEHHIALEQFQFVCVLRQILEYCPIPENKL